MQIDETEIKKYLDAQMFFAEDIKLYQKNNDIADYLIDNKYIMRISKTIPDKQVKLDRVKSVLLTPKIHSSGLFEAPGSEYYYSISDYVQGDDLLNVIQNLTDEEKNNIGTELAQFLKELHSITGDSYDIGHYIPTIPRYKGSWKNGHLEYLKVLQSGLSEMNMESAKNGIISQAFDYIYANVNSLDYEMGAKLLHNDFHPKNIIVNEGKLAGIIDWECSQFGEPDFELTHLFHWCIYSVPNNSLGLLLKSVVENLQIYLNIPNIEKRLTIYQLEHELNQIIWTGNAQKNDRMERIDGWLSGRISTLLSV